MKASNMIALSDISIEHLKGCLEEVEKDSATCKRSLESLSHTTQYWRFTITSNRRE